MGKNKEIFMQEKQNSDFELQYAYEQYSFIREYYEKQKLYYKIKRFLKKIITKNK